MSPLSTLPTLSPDQALLRLHRRGVPGLVLLELLGPLTDQSSLTLLSAAPVSVRHTLPERPTGSGLFPAWIGGLKYEAALAWGLPTHAPQGEAQHWGEYPSGLVWDRRAGTLELVGDPHLDWSALLSGPAPSDLDILPPEALEVDPFSQGDLDYPVGRLASDGWEQTYAADWPQTLHPALVIPG